MPQRRRLVLALLLASSSASAETVVPIPPTPPLPQPAQGVALDPPADLSNIEGKPIARVEVVLDGNVWTDVRTPVIRDIASGQKWNAAAVRRALDELLRTGQFARATATAVPEGSGAALVVRAVPRKLIVRVDVDFHGARVDREDLLRDANLAPGGEILGDEIDRVGSRVARFFGLHGYPTAAVDLQTRATDDSLRTVVSVDVHPGSPRIIEVRHVYVVGPNAEQVRKIAEAYAVGARDRADEPALDEADKSLEQALHGKGWFGAAVSHDLVRVGPTEHGGRVVLRVRVDAGPRQVPRFEGNEHYDAEALTASLALDSELDRSAAHLADKLRLFYQRRGFLDVEVRPEVRGVDSDAIELLVFHIVEHRRVRVRARQYPCLHVDAIQSLSGGGPRSPDEIGNEIDSFLEEELPGAEFFVDPDPRGVNRTIGSGGSPITTDSRAEPLDLHPDAAYVADTYDRAVEHVQELYRNEGFLHAEVGPVQVHRERCDPRSPTNRCIPLAAPAPASSLCAYGPTGLPAAAAPLDPGLTCRSDPARDVDCAPEMDVVIPVRLGPRTRLWDVAFNGVRGASEDEVARAAQLPFGEPVSATKLEAARRRVVDWYKELGYAYVDVKETLEPSLDNTRARLRFDVTEGDPVVVRAIEIRGLVNTREGVVRRRIRLKVGRPYRTSDVERTRERVETLGVFSTVNVSLSNPQIPESEKTVYIDVVERLPRYIELRPGFSTGEGIRGTVEYDERNILGYAVAGVLRAQLSYLPDFLILDSQVASNYALVRDRLARRITLSGAFPEVGLGPQVRAQTDAIYVRDLERDFALDKIAGFANLIYRPVRTVTLTIGQSVEDNDVRLFQLNSVATFLACNPNNPGLSALLRIPDGESLAVAERASVSWDRRDSAFNAHRGTFVYLGAELVNSFPVASAVTPNVNLQTCPNVPNATSLPAAPQAYSHFVRLSQTFAGYIPLFRNVSLALELRLGENVPVAPCHYLDSNAGQDPNFCTYPDRLFFMGGFDSMRGWLQDTFIPEEYAKAIGKDATLCESSSNNCLIPLRGGNLMINPRVELRFPILGALDGAVFADFGNVWVNPTYIADHAFDLRADVGSGVRLQTPVGPLVFDYGINVTRRSYEDFGAFHFAIGLF